MNDTNIPNTALNFVKNFEEKVLDKVNSIEMAELEADRECLNCMGLKNLDSVTKNYGLLVFCNNGLYFDLLENDSFMAFFIRRSSTQQDQKEKIIALHKLCSCQFYFLKKNKFNIFSNNKFRIAFSFLDHFGNDKYCSFLLNKKAEKVYILLKKYNTSND